MKIVSPVSGFQTFGGSRPPSSRQRGPVRQALVRPVSFFSRRPVSVFGSRRVSSIVLSRSVSHNGVGWLLAEKEDNEVMGTTCVVHSAYSGGL